MINSIKNCRKKNHDSFGWIILHPMNDSIIAYADSEEEADRCIQMLNNLDITSEPDSPLTLNEHWADAIWKRFNLEATENEWGALRAAWKLGYTTALTQQPTVFTPHGRLPTPRYVNDDDVEAAKETKWLCKACDKWFVAVRDRDRKEEKDTNIKCISAFYICPCGAKKIVAISPL